MMNWYNTLRHGNRERFPPWKTDTKNTHIQRFTICVERLVCILGTVGVRHRANLPPATSQASSKQFWPSDLQAIYEIWIIPRWGRKCPGILCCVCAIHVTAEWVRDRDDCLWDGVGMRNHHNGNVFVLSRAHQRTHMPEYEWCAHVHMPIQTQVRLLPGVCAHTHKCTALILRSEQQKCCIHRTQQSSCLKYLQKDNYWTATTTTAGGKEKKREKKQNKKKTLVWAFPSLTALW